MNLCTGLHTVLTAIWQSGSIPLDLLRAWSSLSGRGKGDHWDRSNYHGITLLIIPGNLFTHIFLKQTHDHWPPAKAPETKSLNSFLTTIDHILGLWLIVECRREFNRGLFAAYINLKGIWHDALQFALGDPDTGKFLWIIGLIKSLYTGSERAAKCNRSLLNIFSVNSGVRQGCDHAPTLFNTSGLDNVQSYYLKSLSRSIW